MINLIHIFDVYSRRGKATQPFGYNLPSTFRNRVLMLCRDTFNNKDNPCSTGNYIIAFWDEVHQMLTYRYGRPQLSPASPILNSLVDATSFLFSCTDEEFLDFVEYIFRVKCLFHVTSESNELVARFNALFALDGLGYELTDFVYETQMEDTRFGRHPVTTTIAWPQVIRKDNQTIHETAIKPVLRFLSDPVFKSANLEYLESLDDYRKGDWGDSLTKCCSAFESVMKIICKKKRWKYSDNDPAGPLIKAIIAGSNLEQYIEQPLLSIATLRNRYSKAHGAGTQPRKADQPTALLGLNLTAAVILFLSEKTK